MKTISNVLPQSFLIEAIYNDECDVVFTTNVTEREIAGENDGDIETIYEYDLYRIRMPYSENLETRIENNYEAWLDMAINDDLTQLKNEKMSEVRAVCETMITNGIDLETSYGLEHFSLATHDQQNLATIRMMIAGGTMGYPYHADGKQCVFYSAADLNKIIEVATYHVAYHTTYCNMLRVWINRETDNDVISEIYYGIDLPEDLAKDMNDLLGG